MYAIVKSGGKQYRVERGQRLLVERLSAAEGERVALEPIMYRSEEAVFDKGGLEQVTVTATVLGHERGPKLRVFKFKPKRGYKRRTGHRQQLTRIEVTDIAAKAAGGATKTTRAKAVPAKPQSVKTPSAKAAPTAGDSGPAKAEAKPAAAQAGAKPAAAKPAAAKPAGAKRAAAKAKPETAEKED
jgi:large subunit ribosomal protein L21